MLLLAAIAVLVILPLAVWRSLQPPRDFAPGLPVIPLWVAFLPLLRQWLGLPLPGQDWTYARYIAPAMAKHGAVVIYFGSRWNVLIACPQGMRQLFAQERATFQKQGNHKKLPDAVISALTGGNIISETGALWRKFAQVIRPALKDDIEPAGLETATERLVDQLRGHEGPVTPLVQRYSMEAVCLCVLGRDLNFLTAPPAIHRIHALVKRHIFHPLFLSVPSLDAFTRLFPSRALARSLIGDLEVELLSALPGSQAKAKLGLPALEKSEASNVQKRLDEAFVSGLLSEREYIDNVKILFIAGHENAQQALLTLLWVLSHDATLQSRIRSDTTPSPILHATILEALRLFPPIPQLFNRRVAHDTVLSLPGLEVPLKEGTYVGWSAYGLHRGPSSGWEEADTWRPERWGDSIDAMDATMRRMRSEGEFATFHGGLRTCPGQPFATLSLHRVIRAILQEYTITLVTDQGTELTPGGLMAPRDLRLKFERRKVEVSS